MGGDGSRTDGVSAESDHDYSLGAGKVLLATDKALKVLTEDAGVVWIPRSVLHDYSELERHACEGDEGDDVCVAFWWAEKQGWI